MFYVAKAQLKMYPLMTCIIVALCNVFFLSVILNIHEQSVPNSELNLWASFWLGAQTQSSIGYGDVLPLTHIGRICCVFLPLLGYFFMSQLVNTLESLLGVTHKEKKVMQKIWDHCVVRKRLEEISAVLIQRRWKLHHNRVHKVYDIHFRLRYISHLLKFRRYFGVILNEEVFMEAMVQELSGSFEQRVAEMKPLCKETEKISKCAEELNNMWENFQKKVVRTYKNFRRCHDYRSGSGYNGRSSIGSLSGGSGNREARKSTRKVRMQIIQRITTLQETGSPDEPTSSSSLFRKRR